MSSADTVYRVLTVYDAETKNAETSIGGLAIVFDHLLNLMGRAKHALDGILDLHSNVEKTRLTLGGLFQASSFQGAEKFAGALGMADVAMQRMRKAAADLPGTNEDMEEIFTMVTPGAGRSGKSLNAALEMSGQMMAVGKAMKIQSSFIGREFAELMEGRASSRVTMFARLKGYMGHDMTSSKFNAMTDAGRWAAIEKALKGFKDMVDAYGNSWDAVSSTTEQHFKDIVRLGSAALFEQVKGKFKELNGWLDANKDSIVNTASKVGQALANGFGVMRDAIGFLVANKDTLATLATAGAAIWGMSKIAGGKLGSDGKWSKEDKSTILARMLMGGAAGGAFGLLKGGGGLGAGMMAVETAMASLPGTIGQVGIALTALHGGLQWFADWFDDNQKTNIDREAEGRRWMMLYKSRENVYDPTDSYISPKLAAETMAALKRNKLVEELDGGYSFKSKTTIGDFGLLYTNLDATGIKAMARTAELALKYTNEHPEARRYVEDPLNAKSNTKEPPKMNVSVKIEQTIHDADDPNRVLLDTTRAIKDSLHHPTESFLAEVYR